MTDRWFWMIALLGMIVTQPTTEPPPMVKGPPPGNATTQVGFGTIKGRLVWRGDDVPQQKVLVAKGRSNKDVTVCAADDPILDKSLVVDPRTRGVRYCIVYLARPGGGNPGAVTALASKPAVVRVKDCEFEPYVSAFHRDQVIQFQSLDPVNHTVRLGTNPHVLVNRMLPPLGEFEAKVRAERGVIPLVCEIHGFHKGWVMVFDHPFFAVTDEDGAFEISGVPAGGQALAIWQETMKLGGPEPFGGREVQVRPGQVTDIGEIAFDEKR